ncbi:MAG: S9 family peptidase, partial [Gammaproteobacteria bacterium]|nr:S9 family peptidase [Gammaproteobacteria bacterium]
MTQKQHKNYGSWPSKLTSENLATGGHKFGHLTVDNNQVYWLESLPAEGGRVVIVSSGYGQTPKRITPDGYSVRTRVHEYGGADFSVNGEQIIFSNDSDQRLYLQVGSKLPIAITPEPSFKHAVRYTDIVFPENNDWIICVRERHPENGEPLDVINEVVRIS